MTFMWSLKLYFDQCNMQKTSILLVISFKSKSESSTFYFEVILQILTLHLKISYKTG